MKLIHFVRRMILKWFACVISIRSQEQGVTNKKKTNIYRYKVEIDNTIIDLILNEINNHYVRMINFQMI